METPFTLPDFFMPFEYRVNPHLDTARVHSRAWALEMGLLDPANEEASGGKWSEAKYDSTDFPTAAALFYPSADSRELELQSDWAIVVWFVDDIVQHVHRRCTTSQQYSRWIDTLMAFMPVEPRTVPAPEQAAGRALADLWTRTAPRMSPGWRRRFAGHFRRFLEGCRWAEVTTALDRPPDPLDYIQLRRDFGNVPAAVDLLEHATGAEIPPAVYRSRPYQVLIDTASDIADLQNDIVSYAKEAAQGEGATNGVRVFQRSAGGTLQETVTLVDRLTTVRVRTFQAAADIDLPQVLDELGCTSRDAVLRHVEALKTMLAGMYEWPRRTARYGVKTD